RESPGALQPGVFRAAAGGEQGGEQKAGKSRCNGTHPAIETEPASRHQPGLRASLSVSAADCTMRTCRTPRFVCKNPMSVEFPSVEALRKLKAAQERYVLILGLGIGVTLVLYFFTFAQVIDRGYTGVL